jgi:hypothetical protein
MKYLKLLIVSGLVAGMLAATSCEFGDTNVNPNSATDAPMNVLLPAAQANLIYGIHGDISQFNSLLLQHTSGVENIYITVGQYDLNPNLASRVWNGNLYPGAMKDLQLVIGKSFQNNSPHYRGVARILMATALAQVVDLWNNAPYTEAFQGDAGSPNFTPGYQPGPVLYDTALNLLSAAIADLAAPTSFQSPRRDDLVYAGDRAAWTRAARALQARLHNHLSKVDPQGSASRALAAIDAGALASNAQDARIVFGTAVNTPSPWFAHLSGSFGNGNRVSAFLVGLMQQRNDPRLPFYARRTAAGTFVGSPSGGPINANASLVGPYFNRPEAPANLVTYVELKFVEAEAALRAGNPLRAAAAHNEAVRASVTKMTAPLPAVGLATDAAANTAYLAANASETASSITLEKILTEKYLALFLDPEAWTDWRRSITAAAPTGIPALALAANSQTFTQGRFPRRWPYPILETQTNGANVAAQGPASLTDRVFWDR